VSYSKTKSVPSAGATHPVISMTSPLSCQVNQTGPQGNNSYQYGIHFFDWKNLFSKQLLEYVLKGSFIDTLSFTTQEKEKLSSEEFHYFA
jgi:hypothetical protein